MTKIWFITGRSRGLGPCLTEAVLASGDKVVATARNPEQQQALYLIKEEGKAPSEI
jgi:NAD(P)-dependent dehydrogenase (short-subunit alcohol dehydrogenase family)